MRPRPLRISRRRPSLWWVVKFLYGADFHRVKGFTFGNVMYFPTLNTEYWVLKHEERHAQQQKFSRIWGAVCFARYYLSRRYRFACELDAWKYAIREGGAPKEVAAKSLSSPFYGSMVTYDEAMRIL